jgi:hypothetical protein
MGGSSSVGNNGGQSGVYGTLGTPAAVNIPGGRSGAPSWIDSSGNLWLFGGSGYDSAGTEGTLNDLWKFNPSLGAHGEWAWMGGSSTISCPNGPVFGCYQFEAYGTEGTPAAGNVPGSRWGATSWIDSSNHLWLFGGEGYVAGGNEGWLNELWEFNPSLGAHGEWAFMGGNSVINQSGMYGTVDNFAAGNTPGGRYGASNWTDSSGNFWLFGGNGYDGAGNLGSLDDLWELNPSLGTNGEWAWMGGSSTHNQSGMYGVLGTPASGNIPGGRAQGSSWTDSRGNFWLFGGGGLDANGKNGDLNDLWEYSFPAAATPVFSEPSDTYTSALAVTISDTTPNEVIYYTTDGTTPTTSSSVYGIGSLITVSSTETLEAIATASGYSTSAVATAIYTITQPAAATPTFSPVAGTYSSTQTVTISDTTTGAAILYTTDGTTPSYTGNGLSPIPGPSTTRYSGPITVSSTETIEAIATAFNYSSSAVGTAQYTISATTASVTDDETITVTDTETFPDVADSETITVTDTDKVSAYNTIVITPSVASFNASSGTGYATHAYTPVTFSATGGDGTTLTLSESGTLPSGLTFNNGVLSGKPTTYSVSSFPFSITATDADGNSLTLPGYMLTIQPASAFPASVTDLETITVTDTETFPDVADAETIKVTDTDTVRAFNAIAIAPTSATFNASSSAIGIISQPYAPATFTATGGTGTLTLTEAGTLPSGVTFKNGALSGTPSATSAGSYPFSITASDTYGDAATQTGYTLTVTTLAAPTVTDVSPNTGPPAGGTSVTIKGANFTTNATVNFGPNPATNVTYVSPTELTATSPAETGTVNPSMIEVTVTTPAGSSSSTPANHFTYVANPAPVITTQPSSKTVTLGSTASFSVAATGTPTLTYSWQYLSGSVWKSWAVGTGYNTANFTTLPTNANYNGLQIRVLVTDGNSLSTASNVVTVTVNSPPVITTQPVNQTVTLGSTALFSVAATGTPTLTYSWQYLSGSVWKPWGVGTGYNTAKFTTLPTNANYNGLQIRVLVTDGNSLSTASNPVTLTVNQATPAVAIASSANPVLVQNSLTLTATVTSAAGTPTGTVTFLDGSTPLGTGTLADGVATLTTSSLTVGTHSISAAYSGDQNFVTATSGPLTQVVQDFSIKVNPSAPAVVTVLPGGTVVYTFTVTPPTGSTFPANIVLTASGLPAGATYSFSPASITAGEGSTTVTLTIVLPQTNAGTRQVAVRPSIQLATNSGGKSGGKGGSVVRRLAPFTLALILLPFAGRLRRAGSRLRRTVSLLLFMLAGMGAITGLSGCGSGTGFFAQPPEAYTVTVTATSGALSHSFTFTLTVE